MAENFTAGETIVLSATTTSNTTAFTLAQSALYPDCLVTNAGGETAFVNFGIGNGVLSNTPGAGALGATPILPGESMVLRKGVGNTTCAGLAVSGITTLYFTAGQGN